MLASDLAEAFLRLVRLGIGKETRQPEERMHIDWPALEALANEQGLSAIVLDGLDKLLPNTYDMPVSMKKQWIGRVVQRYEIRYELYCSTIAEMVAFYNAHGFKMMVLKGYACSLDWPKPEHRPCGDIDIWQFGEYEEADAALAKEKGVRIDTSHHHHTVFFWRDFMVENHFDFVNVHHRKSNVKLEATLKELAADDGHYAEILGERVILPSADLHILFMLRHAQGHFASTGMNLRQLLDWGFAMERHATEIHWTKILPLIQEYHMYDFFNCLNAICVEDLGFDNAVFSYGQVDKSIKNRVLSDILSREFRGKAPSQVLPRIVFKYRRWRANAWKHRLCYEESLWSAFWTGVWNHILRPGSI